MTPRGMGSLVASLKRQVAFFQLSLVAVPWLSLAPLGAAEEAAFEFMKLPITLMSVGIRFEKWRILSVSAGAGARRALRLFKSLLTFKGGLILFLLRAIGGCR